MATHLGAFRGAADGTYSMVVQVTPDDLGPVTIHVQVREGQLDVSLRSNLADSRLLLAKAVPELHRHLLEAGLSCSRVLVDSDKGSASSSQAGQEAQSQHGGHDAPQERRAWSWMNSGEPHEQQVSALVPDQPTSTGVDVRV